MSDPIEKESNPWGKKISKSFPIQMDRPEIMKSFLICENQTRAFLVETDVGCGSGHTDSFVLNFNT